jgi:hypothetical protein
MKLATTPAEQRAWMGQWRQAARALEEVKYQELICFSGGIAVQRWGEPRLTDDADAKLGQSAGLSKWRP